MTEAAATPLHGGLDAGFVRSLVMLMRGHDTYGVWQRKPDDELLGSFVRTREQRKKIAVIGDPDPRTLWRLEMFYTAIALSLTRRSGVDVTSLLKVSAEGFGRVLLVGGRLVVLDRALRDVHRFGFESIDALVEAGEGLIDDGVAMIARFSDAAHATD